jgi:mannosyl-3-phosphoglycerate phosphatase
VTASTLVVFTDLDGTLLDHETYDAGPALPALRHLSSLGVPVIPVTSKTRDEVLVVRRQLSLSGPFVVENGGAIYVPVGTFEGLEGHSRDGLVEILLGEPYSMIRRALSELRAAEGYSFEGFGDVSAEQVAAWTGLEPQSAARARARATSEPIRFAGDDDALARFQSALAARGLSAVRGGRFVSVQGRTSKGKAVRHLLTLYAAASQEPVTSVALGDSENDRSMLMAADIAIVVPRPAPRRPLSLDHPRLVRPSRPGPAGFCAGIEQVLAEYGV